MAATRSGSSSHLKTSSTGAARSTDPARWIIPSGVYRPYSPVISEGHLVSAEPLGTSVGLARPPG